MADVKERKERVQKFKRTVDTEAVIRGIERRFYDDLTWVFDEYPTFTIRRTILRHWLDHSICVYHHWQADWIEARVIDLKKEDGETNSGFWKELLGWYVFNTTCGLDFDATAILVNRALDFAIGITKMDDSGGSHGFCYRSDVLKIIVGRLDRSPEIYHDLKTPKTLKLFLESFLVETYQSKFPIIDCRMVDIRRIVNCAIRVEDWEFLPLIQQVHQKLYNQRRSKKYDFKQEAEIEESLAFLKEAIRLCEEKQREVKE